MLRAMKNQSKKREVIAPTTADPQHDPSSGPSASPLLVDAKTAASILSVSPRTLWTLTNCGAIPSKQIGRAVRYSPAELQAWVDAGCPTEPGAARSILTPPRGERRST